MTATLKTTSTFNLQNVKCAGCVNKIQTKLNQLDEVADARVNLLDKTLVVSYANDNKVDELVIQNVVALGYGASLEQINDDKLNIWNAVFLPIVISIVLMMITMQSSLMIDYRSNNGFAIGIVFAIISLVVSLYSGYKPLVSGVKGFIHRNLNMYSLVVLGVASAWIYSLWVVLITRYGEYFGNSHVYFDSALMIIGVINLGSYLEDRAKQTATNAIRGLNELIPDTAQVLIDGVEQTIATNLLRTEHIIKIKAGDKIPADGEIISGNGLVNEAMISGESVPISKKLGDKVTGGSINLSGSFEFQVTAVGSATFLSQIVELIKNASLAKPKLVTLADKIVKVFVPMVILIAIIAASIWYFGASKNNLYHAISVFMSVLLIACPCSIGLAIPVSLVVGVGRGAKQGILIQDSSCLSDVDKLGVVLLDKTGTITEGVPEVVKFEINNNIQRDELLIKVAMIESLSSHPLAQTIVDYCKIEQNQIPISEFNTHDGLGVSAVIDDELWQIGSRKYMETINLTTTELFINNDTTQVYVARNSEVVARFDIADKIKTDSKNAIAKLKSLGVQVYMVTGDNEQVAQSIAKQVGITQVIANCLPQDKLALVKKLQAQGLKVAFVGDGINDAPSLTAANIGVAIGGGLDIAKQSASISLVSNSLHSVYDALLLAHDIQLNMRQNLYGSFIYNFIAILIAAGVFYPLFGILLNPMIASLAMSMSSICVILNALRLRM